MSIIAVGGVPPKTNLKEVVKAVAWPIHGVFEALNFGPTVNGFRVCYLRLADKLNPKQVVERINNNQTMKKGCRLHAFIPDHIPDMPVSLKPKKLTERLRRSLKIAPNVSRQQLIYISHDQIMREMQVKFTRLYGLSAKNNHILLKKIGQEVYDRIIAILNTNTNLDTCFMLTKMYRKRHPHFGDFQFILSTLHQVQDVHGKPRTQIQESELIKVPESPYTIHKLPFEKVDSILTKYTSRVNQKIVAHIEKLKENAEQENGGTVDETRRKVREHLYDMLPYIPNITREVIRKHFIPKQLPSHIVKIYGEPYLPNKEVMAPFVARHRGTGVIRSEHMYNMLLVRVSREHHAALIAANGTMIGGAKLVIRPSNTSCLKQHPSIFERKSNSHTQQNQKMDVDWNEQW